METCSNCEKPIEKDQAHPLTTYSFECLKEFKNKTGIKFKPLPFRRMYQKGQGKSHSIWVEEPRKKKRPLELFPYRETIRR
jgi:hypothetical protein